MLTTILLLIFPALMVYAAFSDLLTMRIANGLVGLIVLSYAVLVVVSGLSWTEISMALAAAAIVLAISFAFFAFGWIGGGDAKLVSATILWLGFGLMLQYMIYAALLGGALTLVILWLRRYPLSAQLASHGWIDRLHNPKSGVPYGVALAVAGLLVYPQTVIFQQLSVG